MYEDFNLPIAYTSKKNELSKTIIDDLELLETKDPSCSSIYNIVFQPNSIFGKQVLNKWSKYTTTDKQFLKDFKKHIQDISGETDFNTCKNFYDCYNELKKDEAFKSKYQYLDWERLDFLNNYEMFLQGLSLYNLSAPVFSLILPILSLLIPFIILKFTKKIVTFALYKSVLKEQFKNHAIAKMFTEFSQVTPSKKIYYITILFIYFLNIYQNALSCYTFYCNFDKIHTTFTKTTDFLVVVKNKLNMLSNTSKNPTFLKFRENLLYYKNEIEKYVKRLTYLQPYNIANVFLIGKKMKLFYDIRYNNSFEKICNFSFGVIGYLDCINGVKSHLNNKNIYFCNFGNNSHFIKFYHPSLLKDNPVKNSLQCNKNYLISGPNASGKTTLLKSLCINQILSQQLFCGFYKKGKIKMYHHFHVYLNIPDTSGRDSLFQAEARQCKKILDSILENSKNNHFCIFDELYSGTNPIEAVGSALAYLKFLNKYKNVNYFLTTHFLEICKDLEKFLENENISMKSIVDEQNINYTYKIDKSISNVTCGYKVLKQLGYPQDILNNISFN